MTHWLLSAGAGADLERLTQFLLDTAPEHAFATADIVLKALEILAWHPKVGRPVGQGLRELVVSRGASGYLALYQYDETYDLIVVLRVRHQREVDYPASNSQVSKDGNSEQPPPRTRRSKPRHK